jgi:uncharacterized protein YjbJ (UPF0337 family)
LHLGIEMKNIEDVVEEAEKIAGIRGKHAIRRVLHALHGGGRHGAGVGAAMGATSAARREFRLRSEEEGKHSPEDLKKSRRKRVLHHLGSTAASAATGAVLGSAGWKGARMGRKTLGRAVKKGRGHVEGVMSSAHGKVKDTMDHAQTAAKGVMDHAKGTVDHVTDKAKGTLDHASSTAKSLSDTVKHTSDHVVDGVVPRAMVGRPGSKLWAALKKRFGKTKTSSTHPFHTPGRGAATGAAGVAVLSALRHAAKEPGERAKDIRAKLDEKDTKKARRHRHAGGAALAASSAVGGALGGATIGRLNRWGRESYAKAIEGKASEGAAALRRGAIRGFFGLDTIKKLKK